MFVWLLICKPCDYVNQTSSDKNWRKYFNELIQTNTANKTRTGQETIQRSIKINRKSIF